jgi:Transposase DDE domain
MTKVKKNTQTADKPKEKYRVTNWKAYNQALVERGSLTLWIDEEVVADWYHVEEQKPGGQVIYSNRCILCLLSIKCLFRLGFRQTEGFARSLMLMLEMSGELAVPSYSQLCRRQKTLKVSIRAKDRRRLEQGGEKLHIVVDSTGLKVYGEGEWKVRQHGIGKRRTWRKLHLAVNESNNDLLAVKLTTNSVDDAEVVPDLLQQIDEPVDKFGGDGAYDKVKVYDELHERKIEPIIPPREDAAHWTDKEGNDLDHPRNEALNIIEDVGKAEWKKRSGYHRRSKSEVAMFRYKTIFTPKMYARKIENQKTEAQVKCAIINKFNQLGMPVSVKAA